MEALKKAIRELQEVHADELKKRIRKAANLIGPSGEINPPAMSVLRSARVVCAELDGFTRLLEEIEKAEAEEDEGVTNEADEPNEPIRTPDGSEDGSGDEPGSGEDDHGTETPE